MPCAPPVFILHLHDASIITRDPDLPAARLSAASKRMRMYVIKHRGLVLAQPQIRVVLVQFFWPDSTPPKVNIHRRKDIMQPHHLLS